jgi:hypothetical protein
MQAYLAAYFGSPVVDPNSDAGPSLFYQGIGILDPRFAYMKDKVQGYTGVVQAYQDLTELRSVAAVPAPTSAVNIAAGQVLTINVPMTFANASLGVTRNVPIRPFSASVFGAAPVVAAAVLDFGFGFVNATLGSTTVIVSDSRLYTVGMPLVIGTLGNAGGTAPLLTQVASILTATTLSLANPALFTNATAPVGTGDLWGPSPMGFPLPQAAYPFLAGGPGLFLDPRQAIARNVSITGVAGGTGGAITVAGWDIYGMPMRETVAGPAGAVTVYGKKCFKAIGTITPGFTDATHNYTVGTGDVFGIHFRAPFWEEITVYWNATAMTTSQGYLAPDQTEPATATTGDPRGVIQVSASGGGTGIGANASNGTVTGLAMTGRRLDIRQVVNIGAIIRSTPVEPKFLFGVTHF